MRSGPGAARTILLFHIISARPSKQPLMVRTFRKVYGARLLCLFLQEQKKDIIISPGPLANSCCVFELCSFSSVWLAWRTKKSPLSIPKKFGVGWIRKIITGDHDADYSFGCTCDLRALSDILRRATSSGGPHLLKGLSPHHLLDLLPLFTFSFTHTSVFAAYTFDVFAHSLHRECT